MSNDLVGLYLSGMTDLARFAFLVTGDAEAAPRLAQKGLLSTLGRWHDVRHPDELEAFLYRAVTKASPGGSGVPLPRTRKLDLWDRFRRLPRKQRVALVLVNDGGLDTEQVAHVLGCSPGAAARTLGRAHAQLGEPPEIVAAMLRRKAAGFEPRLHPPRRIARLVRVRRALAAGLTSALVAASAVGAFAASTALSRRPAPEPSPERSAPLPGETGLTTALGPCPRPARSLRPGPGAAADAARVAERFARAVKSRDAEAIQAMTDARSAAVPIERWARTRTARGLVATGSRSARLDGQVTASCGSSVAARSWRVFVHDATLTTSAGLAVYYLIRRPQGWLVWGSYKPGPSSASSTERE